MQDTSSKKQIKQKYKPKHQQTGLWPHSALPIRGKTNKQKLSTNLTLYEAYTNHWTNLRRAETTKKKEFNLDAATAAKSHQSCLTLCDPIVGSPPGSPVPGILQARTLEWVDISLSNAWKWKGKVKSLGRVWLFETPWTVAHQAPPLPSPQKRAAAAAAKSHQSCLTLCDPIYGSPSGSSVPWILQARTLEWVAISFPTKKGYWQVNTELAIIIVCEK